MTKDETLKAIIAGAKANGSWDKTYPDDKKAQPAQEPPSEWALIKNILDEYGLQAISFVADWKAAHSIGASENITGMKSHFDVLEHYKDGWKDGFSAAQPEQEPFEYWNAVEGWVKIEEVRKHFETVGCGTIYKTAGEDRVPLYTTPQQRPWVGLTDDEIKHLYPYGRSVWGKETYEAIEAKLKEKNT